MPLTTTLKLQLTANSSKVVNSLVTASVPINYTKTWTWATGTGKDQADKIVIIPRTVTTGTPDDVDLAASLTDVHGDSVTFAKITALIFINNSITPGEIMSVGGDAAAVAAMWGNAADFIKVGPDGAEILIDPSLAAYAVTATSADVLQTAVAAGTAVSYTLIVIGRSA